MLLLGFTSRRTVRRPTSTYFFARPARSSPIRRANYDGAGGRRGQHQGISSHPKRGKPRRPLFLNIHGVMVES